METIFKAVCVGVSFIFLGIQNDDAGIQNDVTGGKKISEGFSLAFNDQNSLNLKIPRTTLI